MRPDSSPDVAYMFHDPSKEKNTYFFVYLSTLSVFYYDILFYFEYA